MGGMGGMGGMGRMGGYRAGPARPCTFQPYVPFPSVLSLRLFGKNRVPHAISDADESNTFVLLYG